MNKDFLNKIQYRIINGKTIKNKNKHSYFASICLKGTNIPFCGGSYIGKNIIVTAAHCVENQLKPEETIVQFKKNNINHKGISYKVKKILIHPKYNVDTLDNDIALIYLKGKPSNRGIKKLLLPTPKQKWLYKTNKKCKILGYGYTENNGNQPYHLQTALIKIINKKEGNSYEDNMITGNMFFAADFMNSNDPSDNKDACTGDSGGPLFTLHNKKKYLIGIVSWGYGCGLDLYPGVYTKVNNYRKWIRQNTGV